MPLEMLAACHGRVHDPCETLLRLLPHVAAIGVMRCFDTAARHHHQDEEQVKRARRGLPDRHPL